ncbi:GWxTD domain-containing protein [Rubrivirga sp. IMCC45206]|uniref:GWxTD domain-containing protein n=1 Tax=Rubrivirga sp. IMCC45206 TaxID=3391614 RepID=UPI00398F9798
MLRFSALAALAALVLAAPASAQQPAPAVSSASSAVVFRPDAATFRYTDDQSLVELYLSLRAESLPFVRTDSGLVASIPVHVQVRTVSQGAPAGAAAPIIDETYDFAYALADTSMIGSGQVFVEQMRMAVAPGAYEIEVAVAPEGESEVRALLELAVPDYAADGGTAISAVQLASDVQRSTDTAHPMWKSGLVVRPNPDAFYGGTRGAVSYYAEVYEPPTAGDEYTLLSFVSESIGGSAIAGHERRATRAVRPVDVVVGQIDVGDLPSGIYFLRLVALDAANEAVAEQSKRFFIINPDVERPESLAGDMTYEETLFAAMGEEELELNVRHARVISTAREQAQIDAIVTDDDRRRFLTNFWAARDTDGIPRSNEARRAFYDRLRLVEQRFSEFGKEPYRTDRGRIYLTYGPPTEIDRRIFEADAYPHEVWYYDNIPGEGRSIFVFVDRFSSDQYDLLHSDVTGEVSLPSWETEIVR